MERFIRYKAFILVSIVIVLLSACKNTTTGNDPVPTVIVNGRVISQQAPTTKPQGSSNSSVRIAWVIPNAPVEVFSITNFGDTPADVRGWVLKDLKSWTWKLDSLGSIPARTQRILYSDQRQLVNNTGDTLSLVMPTNVVVHQFGFGASQPGDTVKAP